MPDKEWNGEKKAWVREQKKNLLQNNSEDSRDQPVGWAEASITKLWETHLS